VEASRKFVKETLEAVNLPASPPWLESNREELKGRIVRTPEREEVDTPVRELLIVEFYSR
jgi:small subunit ribosomal protein S4